MESEGKCMSFEEIRTRFGIPQKHFFIYLQLRSFIQSWQGQSLVEPPLSTLENITLNCLKGRGQISLSYKQSVVKYKESFNARLQAWRSDLQVDITEEEWQIACLKAQTQTMNTHLRLRQYKWLRRQYITSVRLHHFNPKIPDVCYKCKQEKGTLFHCMWECTQVNCLGLKYWIL